MGNFPKRCYKLRLMGGAATPLPSSKLDDIGSRNPFTRTGDVCHHGHYGEQNILSEFYSYLFALSHHWVALMSAGPFLVDRMITWFWPSGRRWLDSWPGRRPFLFGVLLIGVFIAGFQAWKEEYSAKLALLPKLNPIAIYQGGFQIGVVSAPKIDVINGLIGFNAVTASREMDLTQEFEFRDWKLLCSGQFNAEVSMGAMRQITYTNFLCKIEGHR
ncbi:MAG TPA: hypothetical protein VE999_07680 [Gemmataceae bacterium]|nr:hypothetical protein [Gemmataceae bacterium]